MYAMSALRLGKLLTRQKVTFHLRTGHLVWFPLLFFSPGNLERRNSRDQSTLLTLHWKSFSKANSAAHQSEWSSISAQRSQIVTQVQVNEAQFLAFKLLRPMWDLDPQLQNCEH